jgi:signal transduction histidine kinase
MSLNRTQPSLNRDFYILSLIIISILVLVSIWVAVDTVSTYERNVMKQLESEALRVDRALIVEIENASYILESVGRQIQATGTDSDNVAQLYFSFVKSKEPTRSILSWVNKAQMITVSNNLGVLEHPIDVSDRDYVKKSIAEPWKVHIGRPIDGRLSNKWVLPLSLGLTDKNGTYMGSAVFALDAESLGNDIGHTVKEEGVHFAITNTALTLLTQSRAHEQFFMHNFDTTTLAKIDFDNMKSGTYSTGSLFSNSRIYSYYEHSSQYPYIIFLGIDASTSHQAIYRLLMPRLFQLLVIAVFLLFVLWTVRKRIIFPVIALTERTAQIVHGKPFRNDSYSGPLEIEQLAGEIKRLYEYIEERRRVEAELRSKNNELTRIKEAATLTNHVKADFFAYVGHELTEPVEVILAQIETVKDQHFGPIGNIKYLPPAEDIFDSAKQLLAMLNDIKSISKAETGLMALNESDVDLAFVVQKAARIFREKKAGNFEIHTDLNNELPNVRGDELRLKQTVLNIMNAAATQLNTGDAIRITSSMRAQEVSLIFSYSAPPSLPTSARSRQSLDLALARLLVGMHQGTLEIKTTSDRVTTVTVKLPAIRVV